MSETLWALLAVTVIAEFVVSRTGVVDRFPKLTPWFTGAARAVIALGAAGAGTGLSLVVLSAVMASARLGTAYLMAVVQPRMRQSVHAVRVAEDHANQFRWADYSSRGFAPLVGGMSALTLLLDLGMGALGALQAEGLVGVAAVALAVSMIEAATHFAGMALWNRRQAAFQAAVAGGLRELNPRVVLYTAALPESVANLEQWLPAIESTEESAFVLTREVGVIERLASTSALPIVYVKALGGVEAILPESLEIALYVDTSTLNNHLLRNSELSHVQLHHGDSDKASSSSRLLALYDHHFVAGRAAVDRLAAANVIADAAEATIIGRPIAAALQHQAVNRAEPTVLYAPTWEGYHEDNAVSSLEVAVPIVTRLLGNPRVRTVVRPHPLTGRVDKSMAKTVDQLERLVSGRPSASMSSEPSAAAAVGALGQADVLVTDVSSMLSDFLYTGRPIIVIDVAGLGSDELVRRFPTLAAAYVVRRDLADFDEQLAAALGDDPLAPARDAVARVTIGDLGGDAVGFGDALAKLRP